MIVQKCLFFRCPPLAVWEGPVKVAVVAPGQPSDERPPQNDRGGAIGKIIPPCETYEARAGTRLDDSRTARVRCVRRALVRTHSRVLKNGPICVQARAVRENAPAAACSCWSHCRSRTSLQFHVALDLSLDWQLGPQQPALPPVLPTCTRTNSP